MQKIRAITSRTDGAPFLALVVFLLVPGIAFSGGARENPATITVIGTGELLAEPDQATITVGVQLYNESAQTASLELRERMNTVIQTLRELGIPDQQIRTTNYSIFFERDYQPPFGASAGGSQPTGIYRVENLVRVTIADVATAATIVEATIEAGANLMYGIEFSFSNPEALDVEARTLAVEHARRRAEAVALAAGRELGDAVEITEILGTTPPLYTEMFGGGALMSGGPVPVQPGTTRYGANVRVTYELR